MGLLARSMASMTVTNTATIANIDPDHGNLRIYGYS
jgi:hypothetical protein